MSPLDRERGFALNEAAIIERWQPETRLLFFCSPNNPTGNLLDSAVIERLVARLQGQAIVVVDEAYAEFSGVESFASLLEHHDNLVVLRTLSKAYALAGARCGVLLGDPALVELLRRMIPPYAVPAPTLDVALRALEPPQLAIAARATRAHHCRARTNDIAAAHLSTRWGGLAERGQFPAGPVHRRRPGISIVNRQRPAGKGFRADGRAWRTACASPSARRSRMIVCCAQ